MEYSGDQCIVQHKLTKFRIHTVPILCKFKKAPVEMNCTNKGTILLFNNTVYASSNCVVFKVEVNKFTEVFRIDNGTKTIKLVQYKDKLLAYGSYKFYLFDGFEIQPHSFYMRSIKLQDYDNVLLFQLMGHTIAMVKGAFVVELKEQCCDTIFCGMKMRLVEYNSRRIVLGLGSSANALIIVNNGKICVSIMRSSLMTPLIFQPVNDCKYLNDNIILGKDKFGRGLEWTESVFGCDTNKIQRMTKVWSLMEIVVADTGEEGEEGEENDEVGEGEDNSEQIGDVGEQYGEELGEEEAD